jgi:hypothetical protein
MKKRDGAFAWKEPAEQFNAEQLEFIGFEITNGFMILLCQTI